LHYTLSFLIPRAGRQRVSMRREVILYRKIVLLPTLALTLALSVAFGAAPASARQELKHKLGPKETEQAGKGPFGDIPKGPVQIVISLDQQKLDLYSDGVLIADSPIASGVPQLPTPPGVFSIIQKQVFHRSNIYSNAPMPFMERITWSGVALHEGENIGHPASHGCVRMPRDFALRLYDLTKLGVPVVIARPELKPAEFADPHLFVHKGPPPAPPAPVAAAPEQIAQATQTGQATQTVQAAQTAPTADPAKSGDSAADKPADGTPPDATPAVAANAGNPAVLGLRVSDANVTPQAAPDPVKAVPANKDPIAIFISRKEEKIYVRQDFTPLFSFPITIADSDRPLGTHVFTALDYAGDDHTALRWNVLSLPGEPPPPRKAEKDKRGEKNAEKDVAGGRRGDNKETGVLPPPQMPAEALARIDIPKAAIDAISQLVVPGSSLIVSDHGLGDETGDGTNFIVVTQ
jgi:hypothetical protein